MQITPQDLGYNSVGEAYKPIREKEKRSFRHSQLSLDPRDSAYDDSSTNYQSVPINDHHHASLDYMSLNRQPPSNLAHNSTSSNNSDINTPSHRRVASLTTPRSQFYIQQHGPQSFRGNENRFHFPNIDPSHPNTLINSPSDLERQYNSLNPTYYNAHNQSTASLLRSANPHHPSLNHSRESIQANEFQRRSSLPHNISQYAHSAAYPEDELFRPGSHYLRPSSNPSVQDIYPPAYMEPVRRESYPDNRTNIDRLLQSPGSYWISSPRNTNPYFVPPFRQVPHYPHLASPMAQQTQWQTNNPYISDLGSYREVRGPSRRQNLRDLQHMSSFELEGLGARPSQEQMESAENVYKIGTMVNLLDKFYSLKKVKLMNQAFQKIIVYNHKLELSRQTKALKLMGIFKKKYLITLAHALT